MSTPRTLAAATALVALSTALGCASAPRDTPGESRSAADAAPAVAPRGPGERYLDRQVQELGAIPDVEVTRKPDALIVNVQDEMLYDSNSAVLSSGGADRIRALARMLQGYPQERVIVKGHTDGQGDERSSQRLSEDRADGVRNLLVAEGVTPSRITAVGLGASLPVATSSTAEGRQQNRRIEIELRPDAEVLQGESAQ